MNNRDSSGGRSNAISLADEAAVTEAVSGAILGLWDVVNSLTRLTPSRRDRYRVTIFGSARVQPRTFAYEETRRGPRPSPGWAATSSPAAVPG